jgi:hypothetical protein
VVEAAQNPLGGQANIIDSLRLDACELHQFVFLGQASSSPGIAIGEIP